MDLKMEIGFLARAFLKVGHQLSAASTSLTQYGVVPPSDLVTAIEEVRRNFSDVRDILVCVAVEIDLFPIEQWDFSGKESMQDLHELVRRIDASIAAKARHGAGSPCGEEILQRAARIVMRDGGTPDFLIDCHAKIHELTSMAIGAKTGSAAGGSTNLSSSIAPYARLLMLVEWGDALSDEVWLRFQDDIAKCFGKSLATAAARKRLVVSPTSETGVPVTESQSSASQQTESQSVSSPVEATPPVETPTAPAAGETYQEPVLVAPFDSATHPRLEIREKILQALEKGKDVPAFPATAQKLMEISNRETADIDSMAEVVQVDPGLASRYLRLANSAAYGSCAVTSIGEALLRIGFEEIRRVAMSVKMIDSLTFLRAKVDWNLFWLHSLLAARITDILFDAYRPRTGREYLAGLLHDVGKLYIGHYFPEEFHYVVENATERNCSLIEVEQQLLDITHPEVSSALCEKWCLDREVVQAILYHHTPEDATVGRGFSEGESLLATCICVADAIVNLCNANIVGGTLPSGVDFESSAQWKLLDRFAPRLTLQLDVAGELQKTQEILIDYAPILGRYQKTTSAA
jgi:HD-like signal output (HDOD) protein